MGNDAAPLAAAMADRLAATLRELGQATVAVSGGVDSMTLASFAHRTLGRDAVRMVHAVSPAVPRAATERVKARGAEEDWRLELADAGEFNDERYRANPVNRCYFCKSNLYGLLSAMPGDKVLSGANRDDLGDYRPGLRAAAENNVRHPYVEAGFTKSDVRALARTLGLPELAALPSSPCLSSRIETGLRIEPAALVMIDEIEEWLKQTLAPKTVRCRLRRQGIVIELDEETIARLTPDLKAALITELNMQRPDLDGGKTEIITYRRGSAFVGNKDQTPQ
ncbi:MAG: adenine nucleotide alpha hydrolase [Alphaproteobacteria bacterium]|nr:adenine nucleotide alpha hydrolase [Alphaproteobacteria bacterium]